jgi:hypothetical protein
MPTQVRWGVLKRDLARSVKLLFSKNWLRATNDLPLWDLLKDELRDFVRG